MATNTETWCDRDEHNLFELYADFNEWLENNYQRQACQIALDN